MYVKSKILLAVHIWLSNLKNAELYSHTKLQLDHYFGAFYSHLFRLNHQFIIIFHFWCIFNKRNNMFIVMYNIFRVQYIIHMQRLTNLFNRHAFTIHLINKINEISFQNSNNYEVDISLMRYNCQELITIFNLQSDLARNMKSNKFLETG